MERVLFVFPTQWDVRHLQSEEARVAGVQPVFAAPSDADCPADLDVHAWVRETVARERGRLAGVWSSSDYPGATLAGVLAQELGLPGTPPARLLRAGHKHASRVVQRAAAPEATPRFALVDPRRPDGGPPAIGFPAFVKPVKGAFSVLARRIEDQAALEAFLALPALRAYLDETMRLFDRLVAGWSDLEHGGGWLIAEELLSGALATVEGFAFQGQVSLLGVVDSVVDPATKSFLRFDYPSSLPAAVQERMERIARAVVERLELSHGMFNVELIHDPATDAVHVIEVNPRMCGQFADLYAKVDGVHGYRIALALARGERPLVARRSGPCGAAASVPLRTFRPVRVGREPGAAELEALERAFPGTLVWPECRAGTVLADFDAGEDGASARYAVVNAGAADRAALDARLAQVLGRLDFGLEPLDAGGAPPAREG